MRLDCIFTYNYIIVYFFSQVVVQGSYVLEEGTEGGETKDGRGIELEDPGASTKVEAKDSQVVGAGGPETPNVEGDKDCGAVSIQLFAIDQKYEMRSVDFLPAIFTLFPVSVSVFF